MPYAYRQRMPVIWDIKFTHSITRQRDLDVDKIIFVEQRIFLSACYSYSVLFTIAGDLAPIRKLWGRWLATESVLCLVMPFDIVIVDCRTSPKLPILVALNRVKLDIFIVRRTNLLVLNQFKPLYAWTRMTHSENRRRPTVRIRIQRGRHDRSRTSISGSPGMVW